jgi:polar amino acid transport system substrate-binding protein
VATFQTLLPELLARLDRTAQQAGDFQVGRLPWPQVREEVPRLLEDVRTASNRIKRIVTDLKEYARPDSVEAPASFELNAAVDDAVNLMRPVLRKATNRFELNLAPSLPALFGRKRRIEQIVINLVQNACQALAGTDRAIRVRTFQDQARLVVEVQDEGGGIAPEHLSRLTDPFFTTKRDKGGTGLGLAVSLGIARDHGGELEFRSVPGQGTTARLVLPLPANNPREST